MKHWFLFFLFLSLTGIAAAQTTTVSGTITDGGGQTWNNGTVTFTFFPSPLNPTGPYFQAGVTFNVNTTISGSLSNVGAFSGVTVPDNLTITPSGSLWTVKVCPAATSTCYQTNLTITGATQNISASVTPPAAQVFVNQPPVGYSAYGDSEIQGAKLGSFYFNLTDNTIHMCGGLTPCTWISIGATTSILPSNNTWSGTNNFTVGITGTGNTGALAAGTGILGGNNAFTGTNSHSGPETFTGAVVVNTLQGNPVVGGATYPCTAAGINAATAASPAVGGIVDISGCQSGITGQTTTVTVGSSTQAITMKLGSYTYSGTANPLFLVHPRSTLITVVGTIISQTASSANAVIVAGTGTPAANSGGVEGNGIIQCAGASTASNGLVIGGTSDTGNSTGNAANFVHFGPLTITACGSAEKIGNNVYIVKHDHVQYFGNGGTTGASTISAPSGITLSNENISYVGGTISGPGSGTLSASCVNLLGGVEFEFNDVSFDNCGITVNAAGSNLMLTDSHMEYGFSTTADFITSGASCTACVISIKGGAIREDAVSARTEHISLLGTTSLTINGGFYTAAQATAQLVNVTGLNSNVYLYGWFNNNGNFTVGAAGAGIQRSFDCSNLACNMPQQISTGTAAMTTAAITTLTCGATVTKSAPGTLNTDTVIFSFNGAVGSSVGVLNVSAWPTAGNVNFQYCNPTAGSITPNAATLNWRVER